MATDTRYEFNGKTGKRSLTIFDTDQDPIVTEPEGYMSPVWLERPKAPGEVWMIEGDVDGIPWSACIVSDVTDYGLGWSHIAGLSIGLFGDHDQITAAANRAHMWNFATPPRSIADVYLRAANAAESRLRDIEGTRRVVRAVVEGVPPAGPLGEKVKRDKPEEVRIAAAIYSLVVDFAEAEGIRPKPHKFISEYLVCSEAKSNQLIALARTPRYRRLPPGKVGYAVKPEPRKTRATRGKK